MGDKMLIEEMGREESLHFLSVTRPVRLACAQDNQPYVVPIRVARKHDRLYGYSLMGRKIQWMRQNPLVCIEADEFESMQQWRSVVAFGKFVELPNSENHGRERQIAHSLLFRDSRQWPVGYASTVLYRKGSEAEIVYFRIDVSEVTGRRAEPADAQI